MTSRTVVLRTLAKSWSEVNGVKPVIKKWSLKISKFYLTISASSKPGCWYKRGNEANEVVVHVARISQSSRRNRHDCWHKFVDLEKAEMITTSLGLMIKEHNTPIPQSKRWELPVKEWDLRCEASPWRFERVQCCPTRPHSLPPCDKEKWSGQHSSICPIKKWTRPASASSGLVKSCRAAPPRHWPDICYM